jgi:hypothetical protein
MITPDFEFQRHVGYALSIADAQKLPKIIEVICNLAVLGGIVAVLCKSVEFFTHHMM